MCGIAGMMTKDGTRPPQTAVAAMLAAMAHRGPDGTGTHYAGDTALAHGRLSLIDLATGDQPLFAPDGTALIGNGEIYNYVELRAALPEQGLADHDHVLIGRAGGVERDFHTMAEELGRALERAREGRGDPSGGRRPRKGNRKRWSTSSS